MISKLFGFDGVFVKATSMNIKGLKFVITGGASGMGADPREYD